MPIYEYVCDGCGAEGEELLTFSQAGTVKFICDCGREMRRIFSLAHFTVPETGRDKVLATLNREEGAKDFPGGDKHRSRYEEALVKGIDGSQRSSQLGQYRPIKGARA